MSYVLPIRPAELNMITPGVDGVQQYRYSWECTLLQSVSVKF